MFNYLNQPYIETEALDANEGYLYAQWVESWGSPPDTIQVSSDLDNIPLNCAIFSLDQDWTFEDGWGKPYWVSNPNFPSKEFFAESEQQDFIDYGVLLPFPVQHGLLGEWHAPWYGDPKIINATAATAGEYNGYV